MSAIGCSPAAGVKDAYDPDNVFYLNHNIAPSGR
jgi:Berberine and berberine like